MNKAYRLIKNRESGLVQVVPETARTNGKGKSLVKAGALAVLLAGVAPAALGASTYWNVLTGDWFTAGNWDTSAVPTSSDDAYIDNNGTAQVQSAGAQASIVYVSNSANNGTLAISNGGTLTSFVGAVGMSSGTGSVTVDGSGSQWTNFVMYLGDGAGSGTLDITNGGRVDSSISLNLGNLAGSSGAVTVDGTGSIYNVGSSGSGNLYVGYTGTGTLDITNGGTVTNPSGYMVGYIGYAVGSNGAVTVDGAGSTWNKLGTLYVGYAGTGTLDITNGGTVSAARTFIGSNSASGTVTVDGTGSTLGSTSDVFVGEDGDGTLTIKNGGTVNTPWTYVGVNGGSSEATVDGTGSSLNGIGMYVGYGGNGSGTLNITNGGAVNLAGGTGTVTLGVFATNNGTLNIGDGGAAGILNAAVVNGGDGTATLNFNHTDSAYYFTKDGTSTGGAINITGSTAVNQIGSGTTYLTGANTYTGTTTVSAGTLDITNGSALGSTAGGTTVSSGATLALQGGINVGAEALTLNGSGVSGGGALRNVSGINSFGGTVTLASASTITSAADVLYLSGNIDNGGNLLTFDVTTGSGLEVSGGISGTGGLTKSGAGLLQLDGMNSYSGTTTLNAGYLYLNSGDAIADTGSVVLNGGTLGIIQSETVGSINGTGDIVFAFTPGQTLTLGGNNASTTLSGTIYEYGGGTGSLVKSGTGTFTLTGTNTYTGGTTIADGALQIGDGGTTGSITGDIINNSSLIFNRAGALTYGGVISGTGSMTKLGAGTLTLTGANTYSGNTNINAGALFVNGSIVSDTFVNSGGTLGGTGSLGNVTVNSGGTLSPGNSPGTITMASLTLDPGATTLMQIDGTTLGTQYDHIDVTGTASLDGTLDLQFSFMPTVGSIFNLINAGNIVLAGDPTNGFNPITDNISSNLGAAVKVTPVISATEYDILIEQLSFLVAAGGNLTPNQESTATALDSLAGSGNGGTLIGALNMLSAGEIPGALDSLSGVQHTHSLPQVARTTRQFMHILGDRLGWADYASNTAANGFDNFKLAYSGDNVASLFGAPVKTRHSSNVWLRAMGGVGDIDNDGNAPGADYKSGGVAIGYDTEVRDGHLAGVAFGFTRSNVDVAAGETDIDSYQLAAYGRKQWDNTYLDATFGIGHHRADSRRQVQFPGFTEVARADYHTDGVGLSLEAGRHYALSATSRVTPFAGLEYGYYRQNGYRETGAGDANLKFGDDSMDSLRSVLGARLNNALNASGESRIDTTLGLSWSHEFLDREASLNPAFAVNGNVPFNIDGPTTDRDRIVASLGASARLSKTAQLDLDYSGEFAESDDHHAISATFRMKW